MQKIHFSIDIKATKEKVWETVFEDATYRVWTKVFNPSSYFIGNWEQGSEIRFVGTDKDGKNEGGMLSRIKKNRPYEFMSIEHIGIIQNGVIDTTSDFVKQWTPAFENYTFTEKNGVTTFSVDVDVPDTEKENFDDMWPKALLILKEIAEK